MADVRLIDRKALLKALRKEKRECEKDGEEFGGESILYAEAFEDAIDMVKNLPVVDAAPVVHGRWIDDRTDIVCSVCNAAYSYEIMYMNRNFEREDLKFCPNCGTKMDGDTP